MATKKAAHHFARKLVKRFQGIHKREGTPKWAFSTRPAIPFIGAKYKRGEGILAYASSENLHEFHGRGLPRKYTGKASWNRYRGHYNAGSGNSDDFFPDVGIGHKNCGGLLTAASLVSRKLKMGLPTDPDKFLETIAISNWSKFSINARTYRSPMRSARKLEDSLRYVQSELELLQPLVIIIPHKIWEHKKLRPKIKAAAREAHLLVARQFAPQGVNALPQEMAPRGQAFAKRVKDKALKSWVGELKLSGFCVDKFWAYLADVNKQVRPWKAQAAHHRRRRIRAR